MSDTATSSCSTARDQIGAHQAAPAEHLAQCAACQRYADRVGEISAALDQLGGGLDDLAGARIEARVLAALQERPDRSLAWRRWAAWAVVPAAAAAIVLAVLWAPAELRRAPLAPRWIAGFVPDGEVTRTLFDGALARMVVPEGGRIGAQIEDTAIVELEGPAELTSAPSAARDVELVLVSGRLRVDVEHQPGRVFRVRAHDVHVEVVGTRFFVDVRGAEVHVGVARGRVRVRRGDEAIELSAGAAWSSRTGLGSLDREETRRLSAFRAERLSRWGVVQLEDPAGVEVRAFGGGSLGVSPLWVALPPGRAALELRRGERLLASPNVEVQEGTATQLTVVEPEPDQPAGAEASPPSPSPLASTPPPSPASGRLPSAPPLDAEAMYRRAERAMGAGDRAGAAEHLDALIREFPGDLLAASALYERARLAIELGDRGLARARLTTLLERPSADRAIVEPAHLLACQLELDDGHADRARDCWVRFRASFPRSVHDRDVLVDLAQSAEASGGCQAARPWLEELIGLYPHHAAGRDASARLRSCPR